MVLTWYTIVMFRAKNNMYFNRRRRRKKKWRLPLLGFIFFNLKIFGKKQNRNPKQNNNDANFNIYNSIVYSSFRRVCVCTYLAKQQLTWLGSIFVHWLSWLDLSGWVKFIDRDPCSGTTAANRVVPSMALIVSRKSVFFIRMIKIHR